MSCENCKLNLTSYLLAELTESENQQVEEHLDSGCQRCHAELESVRAGMERLLVATANDVSIEEPDRISARHQSRERVWQAVSARMENDSERRQSDVAPSLEPAGKSPTIGSSIVQFAIAVACGFLIISTIQIAVDRDIRIAGNDSLTAIPPQFSAQDNSFRNDSELRTVSLRRPESPSTECGVVVYDSVEGQIHLFLTGLSPLGRDQRYVFWFRDPSGQAIAESVLEVEDGRVGQLVDIPPFDSVLQFLVTVEPVNFGPQPSGRVAVISADQIRGEDDV